MNHLERTVFVHRYTDTNTLDVRDAVADALVATPFDEHALQGAVWNFVAHRSPTASPARILAQLGALCDDADIPAATRQSRRREVMVWCVEECLADVPAIPLERSTKLLVD